MHLERMDYRMLALLREDESGAKQTRARCRIIVRETQLPQLSVSFKDLWAASLLGRQVEEEELEEVNHYVTVCLEC